MTLSEVLDELEKMGSSSTKDMLMRNHGVREPCFGVRVGDLKKLEKKIKVDHGLALQLYDSGNYDAMYLAGLIADDSLMTWEDLYRWAEKAYGGSLPGSTVAWVAAGSRYGWETALEWIDSDVDGIASAGWSTLSCLVALKDDNQLNLGDLKKLLQRVSSTIHDSPNDRRYSMNNFIISVGCYVRPLFDDALDAAVAIGSVKADLGPNSCRIPDAVEYIRKVEKRGTIGKKRKKVKC